jgi:glycosyltransferase involved in cell wall biosynthesis
MRIAIDARFVVRKPRRGIGTYSLHLLRSLVALDSHINFVLYVDCDDEDGVLPKTPNVRIRQLWPSTYPLWEQFVLPWAVQRDEIDLLHTLGNTAPLWLPSRTKLVLSLMDVMFLQSGEFIPKPTTLYQRAGRLYRAWVSPVNARRSQAVITISDFSRKDILELISGVSPQKVVPIHLACDPLFSIANKSESKIADRPFLLCLGAKDPRKNTLRIVQAYLHALNNHGLEHNLVISGYANWEGSPAHRLVQEARAESRVKFLSFVSVEDLASLYQHATALLYISLYEGFGIPILEAFVSECPVIASNTTSIPEVGGDAAIYVDPSNVSEIEEAVVRLCNDPLLQSQLRIRGRMRAKQFSWEKAASETLEVYRRVFALNDGFR